MAMLPLILHFEFGPIYILSDARFILAYCFVLSILIASEIPTISIKKIPIRNDFLYLTMLILGLITIGLIIKPWLALTIIGSLYVFSIPVTSFFYLKIKYCKKCPKKES
jgi:phosphatidylserine synthase